MTGMSASKMIGVELLPSLLDLADPGASWTTMSYKVAILAQCPVLLVKG